MSEQVEIQLRHVESPSSFFFYFERDVARNRNHGRDSRNKIAVAISQYACNNKNHQGFVPTVDSVSEIVLLSFYLKRVVKTLLKLVQKNSSPFYFPF